jgi:hypothetical protein
MMTAYRIAVSQFRSRWSAMIVVALIWFTMPLVGWAYGSRSHTRRTGVGLLLGLLFGPVGLLVLAALGPSPRARRDSAVEWVNS